MSDFARPEIYDIVADAIQSALLNLHVGSVGIVQTYDDATQTCSVQPAVKRPVPVDDGSVQTETLPVVQNVPVIVFGSPKASFQVELAKGDTVLLVYLDFSPAGWRGSGAVSDPLDVRQHGPAYPVAIPWYRPAGRGGADAASSLGAAGGARLKFLASTIEAGDAAQLVAIGQKVDTALAALQTILLTLATGLGGNPAIETAAAAAGTALTSALGSWPGPTTGGTVLKAAP